MSYVTPHSILAIGVTFIVTGILAVTARLCSRRKGGQKLELDDWTAATALVFVTCACCIMLIGIFCAPYNIDRDSYPPAPSLTGYATGSIGYHSPEVGLEIFTIQLPVQALEKKLEFSFYLIQIPALLCLKLSTRLFYRRIFVGRVFVICFWSLATLSVLWGLSFFIAWASICPHFKNFYTSIQTLRTGCGNSFGVLICQTVLDVLVDLAILVLPVPFIWHLQMSVRRKVVVLGVFLLGGLAIACGFARMIIVAEILGTPLFSRNTILGESTTDFIGIVSLLLFWGMLEIGLAMVAICLPTLGPLMKAISRSILSTNLRSAARLWQSGTNAQKGLQACDSNSGAPDTITILTDITVGLSQNETGATNVLTHPAPSWASPGR